MVRLPWRRRDRRDDEEGDGSDGNDGSGSDAGAGADAAADADGDAPLVRCEFQDGTVSVHEDRVRIERPERSRFDDRTIPTDEVEGVTLETGVTIGHLQVVQRGVEPDTGGFLSDPVDPNTVHFTRSGRECAREARDAILARAGAGSDSESGSGSESGSESESGSGSRSE
jgi:hypothetical protein